MQIPDFAMEVISLGRSPMPPARAATTRLCQKCNILSLFPELLEHDCSKPGGRLLSSRPEASFVSLREV